MQSSVHAVTRDLRLEHDTLSLSNDNVGLAQMLRIEGRESIKGQSLSFSIKWSHLQYEVEQPTMAVVAFELSMLMSTDFRRRLVESLSQETDVCRACGMN